MEITKEKFLEMAKWGNFNQMRQLQKEFPKAFKVELEVGKVYKGNSYFDSLIKITNIENRGEYNKISYYGFATGGRYKVDYIAHKPHEDSLKEATKEEWESALIEEAKKRGYKNGNYKCLYMPHRTEETDKEMFFEDGCIWIGVTNRYNMIYEKGVWAEIIKTFSKEEADKLLGGKII